MAEREPNAVPKLPSWQGTDCHVGIHSEFDRFANLFGARANLGVPTRKVVRFDPDHYIVSQDVVLVIPVEGDGNVARCQIGTLIVTTQMFSNDLCQVLAEVVEERAPR